MDYSGYNLLIITPDQLRADYLGCYGHNTIDTVNIDRLAHEGVRFQNCYCAAPLCAPSRISFATGTYLGEHNHRNYWSEIDPGVPNIVTSLKKAGYRTGMFGKNHLFKYDKLKDVWDELDEICLGNCDGHPEYIHSFSAFTLEAGHEYNITGRLTDETVDFIRRADRPFLAWVNYQDPHPAFTCPAPYDTLFKPEDMELPPNYTDYTESAQPIRNAVWRAHSEMDLCSGADMKKAMAMYMGQIRYVDDCVGKMLEYLDESGLSENTVVLFFSDHGELLGDHGMTHKLPVFYDSLTRIPAILRHPVKKWENTVFNGLMEEVDLAPTLLDILRIEIPPTMVGESMFKALEAGDYSGKESILCEAGGGAPTPMVAVSGMKLKAPFAPTSFGPGSMIRKGDWKLSVYYDDRGELYNIKDDPHEMNNLFDRAEYRAVRDELAMSLLKRVLGVKVRNTGIAWPHDKYAADVRFEPLEY